MQIAVLGTGYVGLVTGVCLASIGHHVTCVDILNERIETINLGKVPFYEPGLAELLKKTLSDGHLRALTNLDEAVAKSDIIFIAVGTPLAGEAIDLSYIKAAGEQVGSALRGSSKYHVVVVKSTVVPGTTDTLVRHSIEQTSGMQSGQFGLCMNPEFLREGSAVNDFMNPDRIIIGQWDSSSGQTLDEVYRPFKCPKIFTTLRNAELIKYTSNALLATLISFSNEISGLCELIPDTDVETIMDGLHLDRRLCPTVDGRLVTPGILSYLRAGCGFGGSCLPKDVNALRAFAHEQGKVLHLLDAVMAVNRERPSHLVTMTEQVLGGLRDRIVTVLGLAFKPGTDDLRDSPAIALIECLLNKGAIVRGYDPVALLAAHSVMNKRVELCDTAESALSHSEAALIAIAWPEFAHWDWNILTSMMRRPVIIDGRNALRKVNLPKDVKYVPIGIKI